MLTPRLQTLRLTLTMLLVDASIKTNAYMTTSTNANTDAHIGTNINTNVNTDIDLDINANARVMHGNFVLGLKYECEYKYQYQ